MNFDVMEKHSGEILDKTLAFDVTITDKNDNPPEFIPEDLYIDVPENIKEGENHTVCKKFYLSLLRRKEWVSLSKMIPVEEVNNLFKHRTF